MSMVLTFDWDAYGRDVMAGKIPVCKWTRLAVERHYRDLKEGGLRGLHFSESHAQHALESFLFLRHSKGEFAGQQFVPSPWQQFWIAMAFGWLRADGTRRFNEVWEEVPRKNGKSTKLAGIGLYLFAFDGEGGAEVYTAATKMDQAKITHSEAVRMVQSSPHLRRHIGERRDELYIAGRADKFVPLGRDSKSMDGLNPHGAILDEVHAHPDRGIIDVIKSGTGARRQWMMWCITTAGKNLTGPGFELHGYAEKVLEGVIEDDAFLAIIYTVDDPEKWDDPIEWEKANPNMGVSVYKDKLAEACDTAKKRPSEQAEFKTKRLNIWLAGGEKWIPVSQWRARGKADLSLDSFAGQKCWIGMDLAERRDIAALALVFRDGDNYTAFFRMYLNEYQVQQPQNRHLYDWHEQGHLIVNPGNATDFDLIAADLRGFAQQFDIQEVAYDPKFAVYFAKKLMEDDHLPMVEIAQTSTRFTSPIIEIENLVLTEQLQHDGNPVMSWMISNSVLLTSKFSGLKQISKQRDSDKIDGVIALIMALGRAMTNEVEDSLSDHLETYGIRRL